MNVNRELLLTLLKELCEINGSSGAENKVRDYIIKKIEGICKYKVTPLGCVIAYYKGDKKPDRKLMLAAHMDEVGLIVTGINEDGTLAVNCVGGVDADTVIGRQVILENGLYGSVGSKAVHNMTDEEKKKPASFDTLYVDIGADTYANAADYVTPGCYAYFTAGYEINDGYIRSKAIDDRVGCAILLAMLTEKVLPYDCTFVFTTREEIGVMGAGTAAFETAPDCAIVVEATTAADIPLSSGDKRCCLLGKGAVLSYMDRATVYDRELYNLSNREAQEKGIPGQTKTVIAGGNDSAVIHISRSGVKTLAMSVPCRYLHTPCCVINSSDYFYTFSLVCETALHILSENNNEM